MFGDRRASVRLFASSLWILILSPNIYSQTVQIEGYDSQPMEFYAPDGNGEKPLILVLHGGMGDANIQKKQTCKWGRITDSSCLHEKANALGYAVAYLNGYGLGRDGSVGTMKFWNAGGGEVFEGTEYRCAGNKACERDIDHYPYLEEVIETADELTGIDRSRIFLVGFSNGAAFAHKLACEQGISVKAVAALAGANQYTTSHECSNYGDVGILMMHGTEDAAWPIDGGIGSSSGEYYFSVHRSFNEWSDRYGCTGSESEYLADKKRDGTRVLKTNATGCTGDRKLEFYQIEGGAHTWPSGSRVITGGRISRDISANDEILDFFGQF